MAKCKPVTKHGKKIHGTFCERKLTPRGQFDSRSFRWKSTGTAHVLVGCPKGHFHRGHCDVGTRAHVILTPK